LAAGVILDDDTGEPEPAGANLDDDTGEPEPAGRRQKWPLADS